LLELLLPLIVRFSLIVARLAGVVTTSPLLGSRFFPPRIRVITAVVLGLIFTVAPGVEAGPIPIHTGVFGLLMIRELLIGAAIGMLVRFIVGAVMMAGSMNGIQMGLGMARAMDPQTRVQVTMVGMVMGLAAVAALFAVDAHHLIIAALYRSFHVAPVGQFSFGPDATLVVIEAGGELFLVAIGLAAPITISIFLTHIGMAFLARTAPQMNIFAVGFAITISTGVILLGVTMPGIVESFDGFRDVLGDRLLRLVRGV